MTKIKNMAYWKAKNNNSPLEQSGYSGGTGLDSDLKRKSNIDPETGQHGSPAEYASPTKSWGAIKEGAKAFWDQSRHSVTRAVKGGIHAYKEHKKKEKEGKA